MLQAMGSPPDSGIETIKEVMHVFDYIVIGAGSACCVMAARLAEAHSVLLIEAGRANPAWDFRLHMPAALSEVLEYLVVVSYHSVFSSLCNRSESVALHDFGNAKGWVHRETIAPASPFTTSDIQGCKPSGLRLSLQTRVL